MGRHERNSSLYMLVPEAAGGRSKGGETATAALILSYTSTAQRLTRRAERGLPNEAIGVHVHVLVGTDLTHTSS